MKGNERDAQTLHSMHITPVPSNFQRSCNIESLRNLSGRVMDTLFGYAMRSCVGSTRVASP
eukprot:scaffold3087_cov288-Chaetoceros_neogracile.AAC.17